MPRARIDRDRRGKRLGRGAPVKENLDFALNMNAERIYRQGKWRYILTHGLPAGGLMFVVAMVMDYAVYRSEWPGRLLLAAVATSLVFSCAWGLGIGWFLWKRIERRALRRQKPLS